MLHFSIRNLLTKKVQAILIMFAIIVSASVSGIAENVSAQTEEGITTTAGYYSLIIGPSGSATQLAMNTMYFTDKPLGTIPKELYSNLMLDKRVKEVIPFAMADSYNGYNMIGTSSAYLHGKNIKDGRLFNDSTELEVVVGYTVAKNNNLKVGDKITTSHGSLEANEGDVEHHIPFTVVGILDNSNSVYDEVLFTQIRSLWTVHEHGHDEEEHHDEDEDHEHEHEHEHGVCAYLIKTTDPASALQLKTIYDGKTHIDEEDGDSFSLQAIEPMETVRNVLKDMDTTRYVMNILSTVILFMSFLIIILITVLNMANMQPEIALMRLIGISIPKINLVYIIQNVFLGLISIMGAYLCTHLGLYLIAAYVRKMGVVLNIWKTYPSEIIILACVFILSILPTFICVICQSRKRTIH